MSSSEQVCASRVMQYVPNLFLGYMYFVPYLHSGSPVYE
jgi:hypothetical protein